MDGSQVITRIQECLNNLVEEVRAGDLGQFWSEDDIAGRLADILRSRLEGSEFEVHRTLPDENGRVPDVSVVPRQEPWADRRYGRRLFDIEIKSFSMRNSGWQETIRAQAVYLANRVKVEKIQGGAVIWRDITPWGREPARGDLQLVEKRTKWMRGLAEECDEPRVRLECLPVKFPGAGTCSVPPLPVALPVSG